MSRNYKLVAAVVMLLLGGALIAWNLRDPDAAFREPPRVKKPITAGQAPAAVQNVIKRLSVAGSRSEVKEETRGDRVQYEVEVTRGNTRTEYEIASDGAIIKQEAKKPKKR
jgi:hypothetical protein